MGGSLPLIAPFGWSPKFWGSTRALAGHGHNRTIFNKGFPNPGGRGISPHGCPPYLGDPTGQLQGGFLKTRCGPPL